MASKQLPQHWFLLRGLGRQSAHWGDFPQKLQQAMPRTVVHCLDLPGTGRLFQRKSPWRLSTIAEQVREQYLHIIEAEKIPEQAPKFLLAISLGGMVAAHWLARHSDFLGAVMINPSLRGFSPWYQRLSPHRYKTLLKILFTKDILQREKWILELTSQVQENADQKGRLRVQWHQQYPMNHQNFFRQLVAAATDFPPTKKPAVPVLLLNSLGDEMVHPDCSMHIQKKWDVPLKRHAWAGHDLPLDDAEWTIEAMRAWLLDQKLESRLVSVQRVANPSSGE